MQMYGQMPPGAYGQPPPAYGGYGAAPAYGQQQYGKGAAPY
jgi:hypothetical protein